MAGSWETAESSSGTLTSPMWRAWQKSPRALVRDHRHKAYGRFQASTSQGGASTSQGGARQLRKKGLRLTHPKEPGLLLMLLLSQRLWL